MNFWFDRGYSYWYRSYVLTMREIRQRWNRYLSMILSKHSYSPLIIVICKFANPSHFFPICHERQYPRIIKGRNNSNP